MATTVARLVLGMQLLEPGFEPSPTAATVVGRLRTAGHPDIEEAVDDALRRTGFDVVDVEWNEMEAGVQAFATIYFAEMWEIDHALVEAEPSDVGADVAGMVATADAFRFGIDEARRSLASWRSAFLDLFGRFELLALPTLPIFPPRCDEVTADSLLSTVIELTRHVAVFNAAGTPCTAQPVPVRGSRLPASLQLVGPHGGEELLLTTARLVESVVADEVSRAR
jgi:amidase